MANLSKFTAAENKRLQKMRQKAKMQSLPSLEDQQSDVDFYMDVPMPLPKPKPKKPVKKNKGGAILMSPRKQMACGGKVHK